MKGFSQFLTLILIFIIVVSLVSLLTLYFMGYFDTITSSFNPNVGDVISSCMKIESAKSNKIYLKNCGSGVIKKDKLSIMIDNDNFNFSMNKDNLGESEIAEITINGSWRLGPGNHKITIFSPGGKVERFVKVVPLDTAILAFNFDESQRTTTYDSSTFGNNGTFIGESFNDGTINGAARVDGKYGKALKFDGLNDYLSAAMSSGPGYSNKTIMFWYKIPSGNGPNNYEVMEWSGVFTLFKQGVNDWELYAFNSSHGIRFRYFDFVTSGDDVWRFKTIVIAYDSAGQPKYVEDYTNGVLIESKTTPDYFSSGQSFGNFYAASAPYSGGIYFNGTIDEVRMWNRSLSLDEIKANMNSSLPTSRTVASWSFEETGSFANDTHIWVKGINGAALSFDGVDDYVEVPHSDNLEFGSNNYTITSWFKAIDNPAFSRMIVTRRENPDESVNVFSLYRNSDKKLFFSVKNNGVNTQSVQSSITTEKDTFYHVAVGRKGPSMFMFINGIDVTQSSSVTGDVPDFTIGFYPGKSDGYYGWPWNGTIDEVRIFNKGLTPDEMISFTLGEFT